MVFERRPDLRLLVLNGITFYLFKRVYLVYIFICKTHTHTDACYIYMCVYFSLKEPSHKPCRMEGLEHKVLQWYLCRMEGWFAADADTISLKCWDEVILKAFHNSFN